MKKYPYNFKVPANTEVEADKKMNALTLLATYLTAEELEKLAWVVKNDPIKTSLAKSYLGM